MGARATVAAWMEGIKRSKSVAADRTARNKRRVVVEISVGNFTGKWRRKSTEVLVESQRLP